ILPSIGSAAASIPFLRRGQISHDGLEPDVDPFRLVSGDRDFDAPLQIPRNGAVLETFVEPALGEGQDGEPPEFFVVEDPLLEAGFEGAEPEEEVGRLALLRGGAVDSASRSGQIARLPPVAALASRGRAGMPEAAVRPFAR